MQPFENLRRWLKGSFVCKRCGKKVYALFFGYGKTICPDCYDGEQPFIFFDGRYWLNRITAHLLKQRVCSYQDRLPPIQHPLTHESHRHQKQSYRRLTAVEACRTVKQSSNHHL